MAIHIRRQQDRGNKGMRLHKLVEKCNILLKYPSFSEKTESVYLGEII